MAFLQSQVESTKLEKEELSKRLKSVKDAAKNGLETTSRRCIYPSFSQQTG